MLNIHNVVPLNCKRPTAQFCICGRTFGNEYQRIVICDYMDPSSIYKRVEFLEGEDDSVTFFFDRAPIQLSPP